MKGIIIVLGSQNDKKGNLSPNSKNRVDRAIEELNKNPGYKLLLTGGFGKFNRTLKPHAYYLKRYTLKKGVKEEEILGIVESGNTVEDAYLSKPILEKYKPKKVFISTSNFHLPRAKYIFERVLADSIITKNCHSRPDRESINSCRILSRMDSRFRGNDTRVRYNLKFIGSKETTSPLMLKRLQAHEKIALIAMKITGIFLPDGKIIK